MLACMESGNFKHEYFFEFKGERYRVHTVVKLTEEAQNYLNARRREVILTEVYFDHHFNVWKYKYEFQSRKWPMPIINKSTDRLPDDMIEKIVTPASYEYASREIFGTESPEYKTGTEHVTPDNQIREVKIGWVIYALAILFSFIFKDWYVRLIIIGMASFVFWKFRQAFVDAHTTYTHDEDNEILLSKYHALYGFDFDKEDDDNE